MKISLNCWQHVCSFCEAEELLALSGTCKAIRRLTEREELWERLVLRSVRVSPFVMVPVDFAKPQWKHAMVALANATAAQVVRGNDPESAMEMSDFTRPWTCFVTGQHVWHEPLGLDFSELQLTLQGVDGASIATERGPLLYCLGGKLLLVRGLHLQKLPSNTSNRTSSLIAVEDDVMRLTLDRCTFQGVPEERRGGGVMFAGGLVLCDEGGRRVVEPNLAMRLVVTGCVFAGFGDRAIFASRLDHHDRPGGVSGELQNCRFRDVGMGLHQDGPGDWSVTDCVFENIGKRGLCFSAMRSLSVSKCRFENGNDSCEGGVFCYDMAALQVSDTVMTRPGHAGLYIANVGDCILSRTEMLAPGRFWAVFDSSQFAEAARLRQSSLSDRARPCTRRVRMKKGAARRMKWTKWKWKLTKTKTASRRLRKPWMRRIWPI